MNLRQVAKFREISAETAEKESVKGKSSTQNIMVVLCYTEGDHKNDVIICSFVSLYQIIRRLFSWPTRSVSLPILWKICVWFSRQFDLSPERGTATSAIIILAHGRDINNTQCTVAVAATAIQCWCWWRWWWRVMMVLLAKWCGNNSFRQCHRSGSLAIREANVRMQMHAVCYASLRFTAVDC